MGKGVVTARYFTYWIWNGISPFIVGVLYSSSRLWILIISECLSLHHIYVESGLELCSTASVPTQVPLYSLTRAMCPPPASVCFAVKGSHTRFYSDKWLRASKAALPAWRARSTLEFMFLVKQSPVCDYKTSSNLALSQDHLCGETYYPDTPEGLVWVWDLTWKTCPNFLVPPSPASLFSHQHHSHCTSL